MANLFEMTLSNGTNVTVSDRLRLTWTGEFRLNDAVELQETIKSILLGQGIVERTGIQPRDYNLAKMGWHQIGKTCHWSEALTQYLKVKEVKVDRYKAPQQNRTRKAEIFKTKGGLNVSVGE